MQLFVEAPNSCLALAQPFALCSTAASVSGNEDAQVQSGHSSSALEFTMESVDKYQLLDYVMAALDEEKRNERTEADSL